VSSDTTNSLLAHVFKKLPLDHSTDLLPLGAFVLAPMGLAQQRLICDRPGSHPFKPPPSAPALAAHISA
jgi:hypothetical protein